MSKSGARILVVDDEKEILRALQRNLSAHGYKIFTAGSGEQALDEIAMHRASISRRCGQWLFWDISGLHDGSPRQYEDLSHSH